jgi:hypothetical protein
MDHIYDWTYMLPPNVLRDWFTVLYLHASILDSLRNKDSFLAEYIHTNVLVDTLGPTVFDISKLTIFPADMLSDSMSYLLYEFSDVLSDSLITWYAFLSDAMSDSVSAYEIWISAISDSISDAVSVILQIYEANISDALSDSLITWYAIIADAVSESAAIISETYESDSMSDIFCVGASLISDSMSEAIYTDAASISDSIADSVSGPFSCGDSMSEFFSLTSNLYLTDSMSESIIVSLLQFTILDALSDLITAIHAMISDTISDSVLLTSIAAILDSMSESVSIYGTNFTWTLDSMSELVSITQIIGLTDSMSDTVGGMFSCSDSMSESVSLTSVAAILDSMSELVSVALSVSGLLTRSTQYVVTSASSISDSTGSLVDDTYAEQTFSLAATQVVLVIYQENNLQADTEFAYGTEAAINVDGTDHSLSYDTPYGANCCCRNCTFWIGTLASGSHTIKGRFCTQVANHGVTVSNRILLVLVLTGTQFQFVDSTTAVTNSTSSLTDDTAAEFTFTPPATCNALILYNATNPTGVTEDVGGKQVAINVNGSDYSIVEKSANSSAQSDSAFTCYETSLASSLQVVKGRFVCDRGAHTVTISRRQLGVLMFDPNSSIVDMVTSSTKETTTSTSLVNDTPAVITRTTSATYWLLVLAVGTKAYPTSSAQYGNCYGIMVDSVDYTNSRGSPYISNYGDSEATVYMEQLAAAAHTIQGRFATNYTSGTAAVTFRIMIGLWLT